MLRETSRQRLSGAAMSDGHAEYVDSLFPQKAEVFVPLVKHFRYAYQSIDFVGCRPFRLSSSLMWTWKSAALKTSAI